MLLVPEGCYTFCLLQSMSRKGAANGNHCYNRMCFKLNFYCSAFYDMVRIHIVRVNLGRIILQFFTHFFS
jgi:hypothetical protein